ncbi:MAG: hypothetical protein RI885_2373 [Actinomycetota bacterium]|jgi:glyoxylase-like metal-dependent hydrolase (beta-lactamase superfamily II)
MPDLTIENIVTAGRSLIDGVDTELRTNVWILGDTAGGPVLVIDPAHDATAVAEVVAGREVTAILLTHGHPDHCGAAQSFAQLVDAPVFLHPADRMLWDRAYPVGSGASFLDLGDGDTFSIAGLTLRVLHTPGHTPGSVCFWIAGDTPDVPGLLFSGDTLFPGGPGSTAREFGDFGAIIESIRSRLLTLHPETTVLPGHGDTTTIGDEAPHLDEWVARGW